jgi:hypothetical protein
MSDSEPDNDNDPDYIPVENQSDDDDTTSSIVVTNAVINQETVEESVGENGAGTAVVVGRRRTKQVVGRKSFSLKFKIDAVSYLHRHGMARTVNHYSVGKTSLKRWRKDEEKMRQQITNKSIKRHRLGNGGRRSTFPTDKIPIIINFVNEQREKNMKVYERTNGNRSGFSLSIYIIV